MDQPSPEYFERLQALESILAACIHTSNQFAGIPSPTTKHYYASTLFTSQCTRGVSLATLAPHSQWAKKKLDVWDFSSMAGLTRSLLEVRAAFHYLCADECSEPEWKCRWNLFNLHDCCHRLGMFELLNPDGEDASGFRVTAEELRQSLSENAFFSRLPEKQQKRFLKGDTAYVYPLEQVTERAGISIRDFKFLYRFLSAQVHGLPFSFYRIGESNRGRGVYSEVEEGYIRLCLSLSLNILMASRNEMHGLFGSITAAPAGPGDHTTSG
jgi:hypothetical protein